jgi:hypothetical protein
MLTLLETQRRMLDAMLKGFLIQTDSKMDDQQRESYLDAMYGMLGWFDAEICYIRNMTNVVENYEKYYKRTLIDDALQSLNTN